MKNKYLIKAFALALAAAIGAGSPVITRAESTAETSEEDSFPDIKECTVINEEIDYDGKKKSIKLSVRDLYGSLLTEDEDYQIIYGKDRSSIGWHEATVRFKGRYEGKKDETVTYAIVPEASVVKKKKVGSHSVTLKWSKSKGAKGYVVSLDLDGDGIEEKEKDVKGTSVTFKGLESGCKYVVKVLPYAKYTHSNLDTVHENKITVKTKGKYIVPVLTAKVTSKKQATLYWRAKKGTDRIILYSRKKADPNVYKEYKYKKLKTFDAKTTDCTVKLSSKKIQEFKLVRYAKKGKKYKKAGDAEVVSAIGKYQTPYLNGYSTYEGSKKNNGAYLLEVDGTVFLSDSCLLPDYYEIYKKVGNGSWKRVKRLPLTEKNRNNGTEGYAYLYRDKNICAGKEIKYKARGCWNRNGKKEYTKFSRVYNAGTLYTRKSGEIKAELLNEGYENTKELLVKFTNNSKKKLLIQKYCEDDGYNSFGYTYGLASESLMGAAYSYDGINYEEIDPEGAYNDEYKEREIVVDKGQSVFIRFIPMYKNGELGTKISAYSQCIIQLPGCGVEGNMCGTLVLDLKAKRAYSYALHDWK